MNSATNKNAVRAEGHARRVARELRMAREGTRRTSTKSRMNLNQLYRANRELRLEINSHPLLKERQRRDPFRDIGNTAEYRGTQCRTGIKGPSRQRRSRTSQFRKGKDDGASMGEQGKTEVEKDGHVLNQRKAVPPTGEERPVYWKLLQQVLANLDLTEEQWRAKYVGE